MKQIFVIESKIGVNNVELREYIEEGQRDSLSVSVKEITGVKQLSCLESWCKSRGQGKEYCENCKLLLT